MHQLIKKGNKSCRNFVKKAGFCTILCIMLLILPIDRNSIKVQAAAQDAPVTVKVGYFYNGDFMHKEDDGTYAGYDIEYYETLAGYANWNIEFVDYDNLQDALKGLQDGDIDILSGLAQTAERQELYLSSGRFASDLERQLRYEPKAEITRQELPVPRGPSSTRL